MIKYLQRLKQKKGFSMVEMIVVITVMAVLMGVILLNIDNRSDRIKSANSAASDFYVAVQSAFTRYMTYPGPLSPVFRENPSGTPYIKYYRGANGNYPYDAAGAGGINPLDNDNYPAPCTLCLEVFVDRGKVAYVNCANGVITNVIAKSGSDDGSEFGRLLKMEIEKRVEYQDGYYYAKISCSPTYDAITNQISEMDVVTVRYAAYSKRPLQNTSDGLHFSNKDYILLNGDVCGVAAPATNNSGRIIRIGTAGTGLL